MTTIEGLKEQTTYLSEVSAPYIAKARDADGRKELAAEAKELAAPYVSSAKTSTKTMLDEKVLKPLDSKLNAAKEYAAPYVASVKERSAPYVAKLDEIRRSERVERMVAAF